MFSEYVLCIIYRYLILGLTADLLMISETCLFILSRYESIDTKLCPLLKPITGI